MSNKPRLISYFGFLTLLLLSTQVQAEVGSTFTATIPVTKPGDSAGSFNLAIGGLSGTASGTFTDTKTGHYKYVVGSGSGYWSTKRASEITNFGSYIRYGLQLNSLQIMQSFNSKVQNTILNSYNNATEDAYVCPTGAGGSSADYNWILLRPRTPEEATLKKVYNDATKNRVGGRVHYTQSGNAVTMTGEGSFDLVNLTEAGTAYAVTPQGSETCDTTNASRQKTTSTGADYLDPFGYFWFGKRDGSNNPQAAMYISTKSSPMVALFAPTQVLDSTVMSTLSNYRFATLYTSWNSKTSITTKTAVITPDTAGTTFTVENVSDLEAPKTSRTALGTITCTSLNSPSNGFCSGTLTLNGVSGTGKSVCMIANIGTQNTISCIAQNPADNRYAITLVATYSKKANLIITPTYSEGTGCKTFSVENPSNRYISSLGIPANPAQQLSGNWSLGASSFSGSGGYCGSSIAPWDTCNIQVCNNDTTATSEVATVRIAYDDGATTVNSTTAVAKVPTTVASVFSNPDGTSYTCHDTSTVHTFTNKFQYNVEYANAAVEDLIASVDADSLLSISVNSPGWSVSSNKATIDCGNANLHDGDQATFYAKYFPDGNLTDNNGSVTFTLHFDVDSDGVNDSADNCPLISNVSQTDTDGDLVGDDCDNCPAVSNVAQTDTDSDGVGDACDNCPAVSNGDQAETVADGDGLGDACDNCPTVSNVGQENNLGGTAAGDVCEDQDLDNVVDGSDNCPLVANGTQDNNKGGTAAGDACEDQDGDGVMDATDNCVTTYNPEQGDSDSDGIGNACDDTDGNSTCTLLTSMTGVNYTNTQSGWSFYVHSVTGCHAQVYATQLGTSTAAYVYDNKLYLSSTGLLHNPYLAFGQGYYLDLSSGLGTITSNYNGYTYYAPDTDGDGYSDLVDNCISAYNPDQADSDADGIGNACDTSDTNCNAITTAYEGVQWYAPNLGWSFYLSSIAANNCSFTLYSPQVGYANAYYYNGALYAKSSSVMYGSYLTIGGGQTMPLSNSNLSAYAGGGYYYNVTTDCAGVMGGTAVVDNCNVCSGGTTGVTACTQDCAGTWGGAAVIGGCDNMCGSTAVTDCNGTCGGTATVDSCGVCGGNNNDCAADMFGTYCSAASKGCSNVCGSNSTVDNCGVCNGNNNDCSPDWTGTYCSAAAKDCSGRCGGAAILDCNGSCGGAAVIDNCGVCGGNNSNCSQDANGTYCATTSLGCNNICNSGLTVDACGVCGGNDCSADANGTYCSAAAKGCNNVCNSGVVADCAGVCGGTATLSGCDNACGSTAVLDCAGVCGGTAVVGGCDNTCGSTAVVDCAGVCGGTAVVGGCDNTCGSTAVVDCAGVCGGSAVLSGCDNACNSTAVVDCAGVCGGSAVLSGCDNTCNSTAVVDACGVCGGDGSSCAP